MPTDSQQLAATPLDSAFPESAARSAFAWEVAAEVASDWPIYLVAFLYCAAATVMAVAMGSQPKLVLLMYRVIWPSAVGCGILIYFLARNLVPAIRRNPHQPLREFLTMSMSQVTPRGVAGLGLVLVQTLAMGAFTSVKNMLTDLSGYVWDRQLAAIDAALAGGTDAWHWVSFLVSNPIVLSAVERTYLTGWMLMLVGVPAVVAMSARLTPIRMQLFLAYLAAWVLIGNVAAGIFMSAGPAFYGDVTGDLARFQPLLDHLAVNSGSALSVFDTQRGLWDAYSHGEVSIGSGISAFPSMHVSMATLWVIVGFSINRRFGYAALAFLIFIMTASVALGWHYAIDGYVSGLLTLIIWRVVGGVLARISAWSNGRTAGPMAARAS